MRITPTTIWIIAQGRSLLAALKRNDCAVKIYSHRSDIHLIKKPLL